MSCPLEGVKQASLTGKKVKAYCILVSNRVNKPFTRVYLNRTNPGTEKVIQCTEGKGAQLE